MPFVVFIEGNDDRSSENHEKAFFGLCFPNMCFSDSYFYFSVIDYHIFFFIYLSKNKFLTKTCENINHTSKMQ